MTTILGVVSLAVALVIFVVAVHLAFYREGVRSGREKGYDEGYLAGRKAADNWWLGVEDQANQVREKIWREEAQL